MRNMLLLFSLNPNKREYGGNKNILVLNEHRYVVVAFTSRKNFHFHRPDVLFSKMKVKTENVLRYPVSSMRPLVL